MKNIFSKIAKLFVAAPSAPNEWTQWQGATIDTSKPQSAYDGAGYFDAEQRRRETKELALREKLTHLVGHPPDLTDD